MYAVLAFSSLFSYYLALPRHDVATVPADRVRVEICEESIPTSNSWPRWASPRATDSYDSPAFGFHRLPYKYIDSGVRADRPSPFLLRATLKITLPPGNHRWLVRGRGAARLLIDGRPVLHTPFPPNLGDGSDGRDPSTWPYLNLGPDFRFAPPGNREAWKAIPSQGKEVVVVLETIVGGRIGKTNLRRPELGETVVAISLEGGESFELLGPGKRTPYTDEAWGRFAAAEEERLDRLDAQNRARLRQGLQPTLAERRAASATWLSAKPGPEVPPLAKGHAAHNAIDHFIASKIASAKPAQPGVVATIRFARDVRPILEAKCYSCHQGAKVKGDLRLDQPSKAIVPGKPEMSELIARITTADADEVMPPKGDRLTAAEVKVLTEWVKEGGQYVEPPGKVMPLSDDLSFLRRVTLDTVGVVPTLAEIESFQADRSPNRRLNVINRLLADPRRADHWVGYWQDVLAENPNILNPTLNNTGPFRWWLHESFLDNKPLDVMVTELVRMRGSERDGGPAGFAVASQNDVPMAEKAAVLASAFLGVNMKCARCHDAPAHQWLQRDLFEMAAMLSEKAIVVPKTSSVPKDKLHPGGRQALIKVTLATGTTVSPAWPFKQFHAGTKLSKAPGARDQLAEWLTDHRNERFAQVAVNRIWQRLMGRGIVEPVDDWEKGTPSHPELLQYLGRELVKSGYDLQHIERFILSSHTYQRAADPDRTEVDAYFSSPVRRRFTAEQVVDSLHSASGKSMAQVGEISLDIDGARDLKNSISLGVPRRAWELASTSNERDRPSLSLPRVQAVVDVLTAFGWRASRPDSTSTRETSPDVLQPAALANSTLAVWMTRLTDDHGITSLAISAKSADELVDQMYLRGLTRLPTDRERSAMVRYLAEGFDSRLVNDKPSPNTAPRSRPRYVSWSNHLRPDANVLKAQFEAEARRGGPTTQRLNAEWRQRAEDAWWAILNAPEFVFVP